MQQTENLDQVTGDTHGSDITASTGTLDDQGVAAVALGVEVDDVIAAHESGDGVREVEPAFSLINMQPSGHE